MKALSLIQPWATAIMIGNKKIETRSWRTSYRGRIAIHAAKSFLKWAREFAETERALGRIPDSLFPRLPFGMIIGFATIVGMRRTEDLEQEITALERLYGDYSSGRWGWILTDILPLPQPIPCKGALSLWEVPRDIIFEPTPRIPDQIKCSPESPCCERRDEYNGYGSDTLLSFICPNHCACHD